MTGSLHHQEVEGLGDAERMPVAALLDTGFVHSTLQEQVGASRAQIISVESEHVRYVPRVSVVASYRVRYTASGHAEEQLTRMYCRACTEEAFPRALERVSRLAWSESPLLSSPIRCPGLYTLMLEFPNDSRLSNLNLLQPKRLTALFDRLLTMDPGEHYELETDLLRYKPEARCVVRVRFKSSSAPRRDAVLRLERPDKPSGTYRLLARLHHTLAEDEFLGVAPPLFAIEAQGVSALEWVDGDRFSDRLTGDTAETELFRLGTALARLHELSPDAVPRQEVTSFMVRAQRSADHLQLSSAHAESAATLMSALVRLESRSEASPIGFIHGDFHQGQVICRPEKLWLLDLDRASASELAFDAGLLLAHLHLLSMKKSLTDRAACERAFLDGYHKRAAFRLADARLRFWTAVGLLELAGKQFRRLRPGWTQRVSEILGCALDLAQDGVPK